MYSDWGTGAKRKADGGGMDNEKWRRTSGGAARGNFADWGSAREFGSSWGRNNGGGGGGAATNWSREKTRGGATWGDTDRGWRDDDHVTRVPSGRGPKYGGSRAWADDPSPVRGPPVRTTRTTSARFDAVAPPKATNVRERASTRSSAGAAPPRGGQVAGTSMIRVSNVPKNLDERDIKDAFEDTGKVLKCLVERGVAYITFASAANAKKAVQTFDRGELNGQTIFVTMEH